MNETDIALIKHKSLTGVFALTSRTFILQIIAFIATFLLTIFLSPQVFGVFYVVSAIISFLSYFSDIGLAAALIQKKEPLTGDDLSTTFTIQQLLVFSISAVSVLLADPVARFYHLDGDGLGLLFALIFSFILSSLKTIPTIQLERSLEFNRLIIPQVLETISFYTIAVVAAWQGRGITSFSWAVVARAVVGLIAMYWVSPWKIRFGFSRKVARSLMSFGVPYQVNSLLALFKDDLLTVFLGRVLTFEQVGYIGWAKKWAEIPVRLIVDSVVKVAFSAFSRLQHSKELLGKALEQTLFGLSVTVFPITVILTFFVFPMVEIIPKYFKWEPALFTFVLISIATAITSVSILLTNTLNAIGKIAITLKYMVLWTILTWIMVVTGISYFGYNGVAIAFLSITSTVFFLIITVKRYVRFSFVDSVKNPVFGAILQAVWYTIWSVWNMHSVIGLLIVGLSGMCLYVCFEWFVERKAILNLLRAVVKAHRFEK